MVTTRTGALLDATAAAVSAPLVYTRLTEAIANPRASTTLIADIISEDAALTARLLRLVNSAFYGFPFPIDTVSQAVMLVGTQQISDLALATSVMTAFDGIPDELVDMESFWLHNVATGVAARILAGLRREPLVERFFVAGVLHDIGRLLLFRQRPEHMREALERCECTGKPLFELERAIFGFDHAALGGALLRAWKLPPKLEDMVAFHHVPSQCTHSVEAALIHVADVVAHTMPLGSSGERAVPPLDPSAWTLLGFDADIVEPTIEQMEAQVGETVRLILSPLA
jgi:HD-like signal output (HDOD) protein